MVQELWNGLTFCTLKKPAGKETMGVTLQPGYNNLHGIPVCVITCSSELTLQIYGTYVSVGIGTGLTL